MTRALYFYCCVLRARHFLILVERGVIAANESAYKFPCLPYTLRKDRCIYQCRKWRVPVINNVTPRSLHNLSVSPSRLLPPGCTKHFTPASINKRGPSSKGKNASLAAVTRSVFAYASPPKFEFAFAPWFLIESKRASFAPTLVLALTEPKPAACNFNCAFSMACLHEATRSI